MKFHKDIFRTMTVLSDLVNDNIDNQEMIYREIKNLITKGIAQNVTQNILQMPFFPYARQS